MYEVECQRAVMAMKVCRLCGLKEVNTNLGFYKINGEIVCWFCLMLDYHTDAAAYIDVPPWL